MPITAELENVKKLEAVGFDHAQALVLAEVQETTAQDTNQDLKDYIHAENKVVRLEIKEVRVEMKEVRAEIKSSQSELLIKLSGIIAICFTVAFTLLKYTAK